MAEMNGGDSNNRYGFHTGMFSSLEQSSPDVPRNAATALMIDPSLNSAQDQDTTNTQQKNTAEAVQALTPLRLSSERTRSLPSTDIDNDSIDEAYVQFILYCNPSIPLVTDTTELKRGFRSMPKTDGKSFDTFALFLLIKKLEAKEIETWSQLVIELGVEPPDTTKNQSSQKVQQFAVRLKVFRHCSYYTERYAAPPAIIVNIIIIAMATCISHGCIFPVLFRQAHPILNRSTTCRRITERASSRRRTSGRRPRATCTITRMAAEAR